MAQNNNINIACDYYTDEEYDQFLDHRSLCEWQDEQASIALLKEEEEARADLDQWLKSEGFFYDTQDQLSGFRVDNSINTVLQYGRSGGLLRG